MPSILSQGYGPALGYQRDIGSLLGGISPTRLPEAPPIPQARVTAPNYQGLSSGYRRQDQAASAANTQTAVSGAATIASLAYLAYLAPFV